MNWSKQVFIVVLYVMTKGSKGRWIGRLASCSQRLTEWVSSNYLLHILDIRMRVYHVTLRRGDKDIFPKILEWSLLLWSGNDVIFFTLKMPQNELIIHESPLFKDSPWHAVPSLSNTKKISINKLNDVGSNFSRHYILFVPDLDWM